MRHDDSRWSGRRSASLALAAGATLGGLLLLGPSVGKLTHEVTGLGGDPYQTLWRMGVFEKPFTNGSLRLPAEPVRNLAPLPWLPLTALLPSPLDYNLVWLLQFPLTALAVAALARRLVAAPPAIASVAGLLAAFAPYRIAQSLGHFGAMQVFWVALALLLADNLLARPTARAGLLLGLALIGTSWTEHQLFLSVLLGLVVFVALRADFASRRARRTAIGALGLAAILTGVGGILPFSRELASATPRTILDPGLKQRLRFSPTLATLLSLPSFHAARGREAGYGNMRASAADSTPVLGPLLLLASALGIFSASGKTRRAVLGVAGVGLLLSFAPRLPGLELLTNEAPILAAIRTYDRFLALPVVVLPILGSALLTQLPRRMALGAAVLLLLEILPGRFFPTQDGALPAYAATLSRAPPGRVLEVSSASDYLVASRAHYASLTHGRPVVGTNAFARVTPTSVDSELRRIPVVRDLLLLRSADLARPTFFGQDPAAIGGAALRSEKIAAIVFHRSVNGQPPVRAAGDTSLVPASEADMAGAQSFLHRLGLPVLSDDGTTEVIAVPTERPVRVPVLGIRGPGWERISRRSDGAVVAAVRTRALFTVRVVAELPVRAYLRINIVDHGRATHLHLERPDGPLTVPIPRQKTAPVRLSLGLLSPGQNDFSLAATREGKEVDGTEIVVENPTLDFSY